MKKKVVLFCVSMLLPQLLLAQDVAIFYLQQDSLGLRNFVLLSDGRGMTSHIVSKEQKQVVVGKPVFAELWSRFPQASLAPYALTAADKGRMHASNNHALKVQVVVNGSRDESNYMVPHDATPPDVEAWLAEYLRMFGETASEAPEGE